MHDVIEFVEYFTYAKGMSRMDHSFHFKNFGVVLSSLRRHKFVSGDKNLVLNLPSLSRHGYALNYLQLCYLYSKVLYIGLGCRAAVVCNGISSSCGLLRLRFIPNV